MTLKKKRANVMIRNKFFIILLALIQSAGFAHAQNYDALFYDYLSHDSVLIKRRGNLLYIEKRPASDIEPEWKIYGLDRSSTFSFDTVNVSFQNGLLVYSNKVGDIQINTNIIDTFPYGRAIPGLSFLGFSGFWPLIYKGEKNVNLRGEKYSCFEFFQNGTIWETHSKYKWQTIIFVDSTLLIPIKVIKIRFATKIASIENIDDINIFYLERVQNVE